MPKPHAQTQPHGRPRERAKFQRDRQTGTRRNQDHANLSTSEALARLPPGETDPLRVLALLIKLFNGRHTSKQKNVSDKTRDERRKFLFRFFRLLKTRAGFKKLPDPRNLGDRHIRAMVAIWQEDGLAAATIQTYFSFLRGLASWIGKPGLVRKPAHYGLRPEEYQRHEAAQRDKSWTGAGIDVESKIAEICAFDCHVGARLRLMLALGIRKKEAVMFLPHRRVMNFEATGLPPEMREADFYVQVKAGAKGGRLRFVPLNTPDRLAALEYAKSVAQGKDAHLGDPAKDLKANQARFSYVMAKFKITRAELGATGHGLRHEEMHDEYIDESGGYLPPVRGGGDAPVEVDRAARRAVAFLAGHNRLRSASSYLGSVRVRKVALEPEKLQSMESGDSVAVGTAPPETR